MSAAPPGDLTTAARTRIALRAELAAHQEAAKKEEARIRDAIKAVEESLSLSGAGVDEEVVRLAETIVRVSDYERGGAEWYSCVRDAIDQFASGEGLSTYVDLWRCYFGTKNYAHWHGQRSDHEYGYGPKHGHIVFRVALTEDARKRTQADLTATEVEAAIYYLTNITRIHDARRNASERAEATDG